MPDSLADDATVARVLGTTGNGNPELITDLLATCTEHIQSHCDRRFLPLGVSPTAKTFRARPGATAISLVPWDFQVAGAFSVVVDPPGSNTTLTLETDFWLEPANSPWGIADRIMLQTPLSASGRSVQLRVMAVWGWASIPQPVAEACAYWVRDLIRAVSAYPQGQQFEEATAIMADGTVPSVCRQLLSPFRHMVVA
jgi:hypothetical protein